MTLLEYVPDLDCRRYKKDYGDPVRNEKDFEDWRNCHELEYSWQSVVRINYLHHFHPVRAYDLALALRRDHLLGWVSVIKIMEHLLYYNKFIEVDHLEQDDERWFMLYLFPRLPLNIQSPYSLLPFNYYERLKLKLPNKTT